LGKQNPEANIGFLEEEKNPSAKNYDRLILGKQNPEANIEFF